MALRENDSYRDLEDNIHDSVRPDSFYPDIQSHSSRSRSTPDASSTSDGSSSAGDRRSAASQSLSDLESSATRGADSTRAGDSSNSTYRDNFLDKDRDASSPTSVSDSVRSAAGFENNVKGVAGDLAKPGVKGKLSALGRLRKLGPVGIATALILGFGIFLAGGQSFMGFGIAQRLIEEYNTMGISTSSRSDHVMVHYMKKGQIPSKMKKALKAQGIKTKSRASGELYFQYTNKKGEKVRVSADDIKNGNFDSEFRTRFEAGTSNYRGHNSGWFGSTTKKILTRLGINRDTYRNWDNSRNMTDEEMATKLREDSANKNKVKESTDADITEREQHTETYIDEYDNEQTRTVTTDTDASVNQSGDLGDEEDIKNRLSDKAKATAKAHALGTGLTVGANMACVYFAAVGTVHATAAAYQMSEMLSISSKFLESSNKTKIGYGTNSPLAAFLNALTRPDPETGEVAAMAEGFAAISTGASGTQYNDNESVQLSNPQALVTKATNNAEYGMEAFMNCAAIKTISAIFNIALDAIGLATGGLATFIKDTVISMALAEAAVAAISYVVETLVGIAAAAIMVDVVENMFGKNLGNYIASGAEQYMSKVHQGTGGSPGTAESLALFWQQQDAYLAEQAEYDRATLSPFDTSSRHTFLGSLMYSLTPLSVSVASSPVTSTLTQAGSVLSGSLSSLLPQAGAIATTDLNRTTGDCPYVESVGAMCDMFGNPYYMTDFSTMEMEPLSPDLSLAANTNSGIQLAIRTTTPGSTEDERNLLKLLSEMTDNTGEHPLNNPGDQNTPPDVNEKSNLAKYIVFCGARDSVLGTIDANIEGQLKDKDGLALASALSESMIPFISDLADIVLSADEALINVGWITGKACVAGNDGDNSTISWQDEGRYYQRFMEDQALYETMGVYDGLEGADDDDEDEGYVEIQRDPADDIIAYDDGTHETGTNAVTAFLDKYYAAHPLDTSYTGQLSRMSGRTPEQISESLDYLDYVEYISSYDSTNLAPSAPAVNADTDLDTLNWPEQPADAAANLAIRPEYITYAPTIYATTA